MKLRQITTLVIVALVLLAGCERKVEPPGAEERQAILKEAPKVFGTVDDHATLRGVEALYLGQSKDEALDKLGELCPKTMEYRAGEMGGNAWFRGCVFDEPRGPIQSMRVGFWPRVDDRVATLEVKRTDIALKAVRERFRDFADEITVDLPRAGILEMRSKKYQLMADVDEGAEGPTHITLGYTQGWADQLQKASK